MLRGGEGPRVRGVGEGVLGGLMGISECVAYENEYCVTLIGCVVLCCVVLIGVCVESPVEPPLRRD